MAIEDILKRGKPVGTSETKSLLQKGRPVVKKAGFLPENEIGTGFLKGAGTFGEGLGVSPFQSFQKVAGAVTTAVGGKQLKRTQESLKQFGSVIDRVVVAASEMKDDTKKKQLLDLARQSLNQLQGLQKKHTGKIARLQKAVSGEIPQEFRPQGTREQIGYGAEKLGEFLLPSRYIGIANRILTGNVARVIPGTGKVATGVKSLLNVGLRAGTEAGAAAGVTAFQGGSKEEVKRNAKLAAYISAGIGVLGLTGKVTGGFLINRSRRLYQSALKPSLAGGKSGAARAAKNVETGLREGIVLSERGVQKIADRIDDMETQLGNAIDEAAGIVRDQHGNIIAQARATPGVPTSALKTFIDDTKKFFQGISDVKYAQRAVQDIDDVYTNFVKEYGDTVPVEVAQNIKTNTYRWLKNAYGELSSPIREGNKQLIRGLKEGIVKVAPKVKDVNERLGNLYQFDEALTHAQGRISNLNILGLGTKIIGAGIGGRTGVAVAAIHQLIGMPFSKSGFAIIVNRIGRLLLKLSPEQVAAISASPGGRALYERLTGKAVMELSPAEQKVAKSIADYLENPKLGFSLEDVSKKLVEEGGDTLTTKFLDYAKGKTTLSRQEILDFARRPELKKGEADLLNNLAKDLPEGKLPAQEFADSIRRDLLELKPAKIKPNYYRSYGEGGYPDVPASYPFENIRIKEGNPKNYEEVVFESPITTNGSSHYPNSKNYFAHARGDEVVEGGKKIWREQEIQSDFVQKEGLSKAIEESVEDLKVAYQGDDVWGVVNQKGDVLQEFGGKRPTGGYYGANEARRMAEKFIADNTKQTTGFEKLMPFTNDRFGERIMRERIREKASKGYEKYRLPTGETIGKIEGFQTLQWVNQNGGQLLPNTIKVGNEARQGANGSSWIITDILGDGRFKAVQKDFYEAAKQGMKGETGAALENSKAALEREAETFDLTSKSNPQYRRYSDWGKFLKNKFGGKEITDPQGNTWIEIDLKKEMGKLPVEAFGNAKVGAVLGVGGAIAVAPFAKIAFDYIAENVKDELEARKLTDELNRMIGPEGKVGAENFDTHWDTIKAFIDKGEIENAQKYVEGQVQKMKQ